jgi:hypothetical protein
VDEFWDGSLAAIFGGLAGIGPGGEPIARWWLKKALAGGFLDWNTLRDDSLLLIAFVTAPGSSEREEAAKQGNRILFPGKSGEDVQQSNVVPASDQTLAA